MPKSFPVLEDLRQKAAASHLPLHATLEITHQCNWRCLHCYLTGHLGSRQAELSLAEIKDVFSQLADLQTLFLQLTGGEPFARPDVFAILEAACAAGFAVTVFTNGSLITKEYARRLAQLRLFEVHVSILGMAVAHDAMAQQEGAFAQTVAALDHLREAGLTVRAKLILTQKSYGRYEEMRALARAHADSWVTSVDLIETIDGEPVAAGLLLEAEELRGLRNLVNTDVFCHPEPDPEGHPCNAGRNLLVIDPRGEVYPCVSYRRPAGNVRQQPLADIWNSEPMLEMAGLRQKALTDCAGCADRIYCSYCPGRSWQVTGDPRRPAPGLCARTRRFRTLAARNGEAAAALSPPP